MITWELLIGKVLTLAIVPSGSSTFCFLLRLFDSMFGKNLPQSTNGVKVMIVPAVAISLRKSRRDIDLLLPTFLKGDSVPFILLSSYCSGVSFPFHTFLCCLLLMRLHLSSLIPLIVIEFS